MIWYHMNATSYVISYDIIWYVRRWADHTSANPSPPKREPRNHKSDSNPAMLTYADRSWHMLTHFPYMLTCFPYTLTHVLFILTWIGFVALLWFGNNDNLINYLIVFMSHSEVCHMIAYTEIQQIDPGGLARVPTRPKRAAMLGNTYGRVMLPKTCKTLNMHRKVICSMYVFVHSIYIYIYIERERERKRERERGIETEVLHVHSHREVYTCTARCAFYLRADATAADPLGVHKSATNRIARWKKAHTLNSYGFDQMISSCLGLVIDVVWWQVVIIPTRAWVSLRGPCYALWSVMLRWFCVLKNNPMPFWVVIYEVLWLPLSHFDPLRFTMVYVVFEGDPNVHFES